MRLIDKDEDPELITSLHDEAYRGRPERAMVIKIEGFDWNCPQHLPVRLTLEELQPILAPLQQELGQLRAENAAMKTELATKD